MKQIINLTQNGHYIFVNNKFNGKIPLPIIESSVFDGAMLEAITTTVNDVTDEIEFDNISIQKLPNGDIAYITFPSPYTIFPEKDRTVWYGYRITNAGGSTDIKVLYHGVEENLKFLNT